MAAGRHRLGRLVIHSVSMLVPKPGCEGGRVSPAMTLKVGDKNSTAWSMFEVVDIGPGFDVGAHLHRNAEELFYVLEGQLDLLAFEPRVRTPGSWQRWQSQGYRHTSCSSWASSTASAP